MADENDNVLEGIPQDDAEWIIDELADIKNRFSSEDLFDEILRRHTNKAEQGMELMGDFCEACFYAARQAVDVIEDLQKLARDLRDEHTKSREECIAKLTELAHDVDMATLVERAEE